MDSDRQSLSQLDLPKRKRKFSHRQLISNHWDESTKEQTTLKQYICHNVQSKRKNILALYSTTITNCDPCERTTTNQFSFNERSRFEGRKTRQFRTMEQQNRLKNIKNNENNNGEDMLVSIKFNLQSKDKKSPLNKIRWRSIEEKRTSSFEMPVQSQQNSPRKRKENIKLKPPVPKLPQIKIKSSRRRVGERCGLVSQINPWQYLIIPDSQYLSQV